MSKIYLQIDGKSGRLYEYSKDQKEGFEEYTNTAGSVSFRKYYNRGAYGTLLNVGVRDSKLGQQISTVLKLKNDYIYLQMHLYDTKGNVENRYAESFIRFLGNLKKGTAYRLFPYCIEDAIEASNGKTYNSYGVSVALADLSGEEPTTEDKVEAALIYSKDKTGDNIIPSLVFEKKLGKNRPTAISIATKNEFLLSVLESAVDGHLKYEANSNFDNQSESSAPKEEDKAVSSTANTQKQPATTSASNAPDDLPF